MIKGYKKDHIIRSFLDSLYIEKGLSKNTVSSYKNDISSFLSWLNKKQINYQQVSGKNINEFISNLFNSGLKSSSINRKISSIKHIYFYLRKKLLNTRQQMKLKHRNKKNIYLYLCQKMRLKDCLAVQIPIEL